MQNTGFPPAAGSILLVDQQQNTAELLKTYLRADGFSVDHAAAPDVALEYANQSRYGMVITDLYREIKARADETRFMFLLRLSAESIRLMGTLERKDVIKKEPLSINEVIGKVRAAFYYE